MESSDAEDERKSQMLDAYSQLQVEIKARNKIMHRKEIVLPCAITETDLEYILEDCNIPNIELNKHVHDNAQLVNLWSEKIRKLKSTSEMQMNLVINEENDRKDEVSCEISRLRQKSEKVFKKIINTQVKFNETISSNDIKGDQEKANYFKDHAKLIEQVCKFDRGLESIICSEKDSFKEHYDKDKIIESVDEFKDLYNVFSQEVISKVYEKGMKTYKNHEHLLAIKEYNKPRSGLVAEVVSAGKLDPFTRQPITKPVRNEVCKHIYDQDSIDLMFKENLFISCPYIGCTNKHFTKKNLCYNP